MAAHLDVPGLLERESEVDAIDRVLLSAERGAGGLLYIEGAPGVGKTRLLQAARRMAGERGFVVLRARGSELERDFPHSLVRQLLEAPLTRAPRPVREHLLAGAARHAKPALGFDDGDAPGMSDGAAVLRGLYWVCAGLAEREPLALLVDDVHWADAPSLRLLAYLAVRLDELALALLVAARPGEAGAEPSTLLRLATDPAATLLRPRPLSGTAVAALVAADLGGLPAHPAFVEACHSATDGNPFLLHELIRACREDGIAPDPAGAARVADVLPSTVSHAILLRLGRLPRDATDVARAAAVLGADADVWRVAALTGLPEERVGAMADMLARSALLRPQRPLTFTHPLAQAAIEQDMPTAERAARHAEASRVLLAEGAPPERMAVHLLVAEPAGDPGVVDALRAAAERAAAQGAPDTAAGYLRRALAEPPPPAHRGDVLFAAGQAEARSGEPLALAHLEAAARDAGEEATRIRAVVGLGRAAVMSARTGEAFDVLERALERFAGADRDVRLLLEGSLVGAAVLDMEKAPRVQQRIQVLAEAVANGPPAPWNVLAVLALHNAMGNGSPDETVRLAMRALAREGPCPELADEAPAYYHAAQALAMAERYDAARAALDKRLQRMRALGASSQVAATACFRAWLQLRLGAVADAEVDARMSLEAMRTETQPMFLSLARGMLIHALLERRGPQAAAGQLPALDASLGHPTLQASLALHARGRLNAGLGRLDAAQGDFLTCGDRLKRHGATSPAMVPWRSDAAIVLAMRGEVERAGELAAEEVALARHHGTPRCLGLALRGAGIVSGGRDGIELLREAADVLGRSNARLDHARALTDLGAALRRAKCRAEARDHLRIALDAAHQCGAGALAARAEVELRSTGARPRRVVLTGLESLTPSERRVAEMAAEGHTNQEIAQLLFITARTVEGHLTHAYQKLDVSSRAELPKAFER